MFFASSGGKKNCKIHAHGQKCFINKANEIKGFPIAEKKEKQESDSHNSNGYNRMEFSFSQMDFARVVLEIVAVK